MIRVALTLEGRRIEDIDRVLDDARRAVLDGQRQGSGASNEAAYKFQVTGREESDD